MSGFGEKASLMFMKTASVDDAVEGNLIYQLIRN